MGPQLEFHFKEYDIQSDTFRPLRQETLDMLNDVYWAYGMVREACTYRYQTPGSLLDVLNGIHKELMRRIKRESAKSSSD